MTGVRTEMAPACSETPAPVGLVELPELVLSPVATVVLLLVAAFVPAVLVEFRETTCWREMKRFNTFCNSLL